jgi:hypothetical protein
MRTGPAPSLSRHHSFHSRALPLATPVSTAVWPALAVPLHITTWPIEEMLHNDAAGFCLAMP